MVELQAHGWNTVATTYLSITFSLYLTPHITITRKYINLYRSHITIYFCLRNSLERTSVECLYIVLFTWITVINLYFYF